LQRKHYELTKSTAGIVVIQKNASNQKTARVCTGVVAGRNVVLTAAHCFQAAAGVTNDWTGITFGTSLPGYSKENYLEVIATVVHPDYSGPKHDIAILRTKDHIKSEQVVPSFVTSMASLAPQTPVSGVGYGSTGTTLADGGTKQRFDAAVCNLVTKENYPLTNGNYENQIRIIDSSSRKQGTCYGDSGGPGFLRNLPQVFGIVFGTAGGVQTEISSCENPDSNYTLIAPYIAWIEKEVGFKLNVSGRAIPVDSSLGWGLPSVVTIANAAPVVSNTTVPANPGSRNDANAFKSGADSTPGLSSDSVAHSSSSENTMDKCD
jgi:secreted trypsin-like serine protease